MQHDEITTLMQNAAKDAVNYAAEQYQIELDFSLPSLAAIDAMLDSLHQQHAQHRHSAEVLFTVCNILGAYIGEVFLANYGGVWHNNTADNAAPYISVQHSDKEFPFASVCYHKITEDSSVSIVGYVKQAAANVMQ